MFESGVRLSNMKFCVTTPMKNGFRIWNRAKVYGHGCREKNDIMNGPFRHTVKVNCMINVTELAFVFDVELWPARRTKLLWWMFRWARHDDFIKKKIIIKSYIKIVLYKSTVSHWLFVYPDGFRNPSWITRRTVSQVKNLRRISWCVLIEPVRNYEPVTEEEETRTASEPDVFGSHLRPSLFGRVTWTLFLRSLGFSSRRHAIKTTLTSARLMHARRVFFIYFLAFLHPGIRSSHFEMRKLVKIGDGSIFRTGLIRIASDEFQ